MPIEYKEIEKIIPQEDHGETISITFDGETLLARKKGYFRSWKGWPLLITGILLIIIFSYLMYIGYHNGKKIQDNAEADLEKGKEKADKMSEGVKKRVFLNQINDTYNEKMDEASNWWLIFWESFILSFFGFPFIIFWLIPKSIQHIRFSGLVKYVALIKKEYYIPGSSPSYTSSSTTQQKSSNSNSHDPSTCPRCLWDADHQRRREIAGHYHWNRRYK